MESGSFNMQTENSSEQAYGCLYKEAKRSLFATALNVIIILFCVIIIAEVVFNTLFMGIYVVNISMTPTLTGAQVLGEDSKGNELFGSGGDFIYVNKYAKPDYGDIVVVYRETSSGGGVKKGNIIKRVVAFGGDTVYISKGVLYINDNIVEEKYIAPEHNDTLSDFGPHKVKENCMFLLGDNRKQSSDSRDNGDYPEKNLVGVVPEWSLKIKSFTTDLYTFFNYTIYGK